jgi:hypothetical protein
MQPVRERGREEEEEEEEEEEFFHHFKREGERERAKERG